MRENVRRDGRGRRPLGWGRSVCLLLASLLPHALAAQSFPARNFGPQDGLLNRSISGISQDPSGFLWIATQNGLFRYDGAQFDKFSRAEGLADPFLSNLWIGEEGTVWAASASGLYYSDPRAGSPSVRRFEEVRFGSAAIVVRENSQFAALGSGRVLATRRGGGPLLLEWQPSLLRWTAEAYSNRHSPLSPKKPVWGVFRDRAGTIWFGCGQSICQRDPASEKPAADETLARVPPSGYELFFQERSGRLWARSTTAVVTWMPGDRAVQDLTRTLPATTFNIYKLRIAQDGFGNVLLTTSTGFSTWDGLRWTPTDTTTAGALAGATDLLPDREGNLWIGTAGAGAFESLGYRQWQNFGAAEGMGSPIVFAIATTRDKTAWIGTKVGVDKVPSAPGMRGAGRAVLPSALAGEQGVKWVTNLVATADGGLWAASDEGKLWHLDARGRIDSRVTGPPGTRRILADSAGTLWLAGRGLATLRCRPPAACGAVDSPLLAGESLNDMVFDRDGTLWLTGEHGLFRVRFPPNSQGIGGRIEIPNTPGTFEQIALGADRTLWLAGNFPGIVRVRPNGPGANAATIVESHTGQELSSDYVESLMGDSRGRLWVGSDQGISVLEGGRFTRITDQDGLVWNDLDWRAFLEDRDGSLWFGTSNGVSHLLHPEAILARKPFSAAIEEGRYDGAPLAPGGAAAWREGILTLHFSGLTFQGNQSLIYHYRLEGFDAKTVDTHFPFARFQQLPPGRYTLHVVVEDPGHHMFSSPAEFTFRLVPPWWRTAAFKALLAALCAGLAVLLWFWSNKALLAQRGKLQRLVAERTTELQRLAVTDALTGLLNRGAIMSALDAETRRARQDAVPLCIAIVDLDHFKRVNDTLGHPAGDAVLREAARRLHAGIRVTDFLGRYGGEEFLLILRDVPCKLGQERCEALRQLLAETPVAFGGHRVTITASIGIAWTRNHLLVEDTLVARADQALYRAKEKGRNRVEVAEDEGGELAEGDEENDENEFKMDALL